MSNNIANIVEKMASSPETPLYNFSLAHEYEKIKQTAAATSFYLRAIEYGHSQDKDLTYISLIKIGNLLEEQDDRDHSSSNNYLQAIAYLPNRPEAYYFLGKFYDRKENWQEAYTNYCIALQHLSNPTIRYSEFIEKVDQFKILIGKAHSGYYVGRVKESKNILEYVFGGRFSVSKTSSLLNNLDRLGLL